MQNLFAGIILLFSCNLLQAQTLKQDSIIPKDSTQKIKTIVKPVQSVLIKPLQENENKSPIANLKGHSARRATLLSAVIPGAGQIYNGKYWKLPILFGAAGTLGYFINFNNNEYQVFRQAYIYRALGDQTDRSLFNLYPDINQLASGRDFFRRNRDLLIILSGFLYLLNITDAAVDAHFRDFNVKDDIQLSIAPTLQPQGGTGLALTLRFK